MIQFGKIFCRSIRTIVNKNDDLIGDILIQDTTQHALRAIAIFVRDEDNCERSVRGHKLAG